MTDVFDTFPKTERVFTLLKMRCRNHHTLLYYDETGIHGRCRHCKVEEVFLWEDIFSGLSASTRSILLDKLMSSME